MKDFSEDLKKLPAQPGVYIMHDEQDAIIYVGKAVNLHNRVRSYFRKIVGRGPQIDRMVKQINRFEYIVTDSELEALILENNLIKEHRPKYNTMLKDDKTYPWIKVTVGEPYPRILFSRQMKKDKAKYFGPFSSAQAVRQTIELINRMYGQELQPRSAPGFWKGASLPEFPYGPVLRALQRECPGGGVPQEDRHGAGVSGRQLQACYPGPHGKNGEGLGGNEI